jgi:3-oxoacyl-[acyl-carrier protein] reductase
MNRFGGQVVVVTGAAQGIGRAIALGFAGEGAAVGLIDIKADKLQSVANEIAGRGGSVIACRGDVSSANDMELAFGRIVQSFGRIDVLVNNAGALERALVEESTDEHWYRMLGVNLLGAVVCSRLAIPVMKRTGGSIINCSSILASFPNTASAAYGVAKLGIVLLTRVMAAELAPYKIRVNCYAPGVANTDFAADVIRERGAQKLEQIAMRRFGEPEDIAKVVLFLASEEAGYITGQCIAVDGGMWVTQTPTRTWNLKP